MRLTLRTLLAYLDDILEPSQTKEIGVKLVESKFASDLVDRIREVMRRRRLAAPDYDGQEGSLDANLMAEYLDNSLPPEKVTDVERECLESDMHLAEAAACHQILTLVLGEPVEIASETRRRMYGLVSQASGDDQAAVAANLVPEAEKDADEVDDLATMLQSKEQTETIGSALPDYLKPRPIWKRAITLAIVVAVPAVFVITFLTDPAYENPLRKWLGWGEATPPAVASNRLPGGAQMARFAQGKTPRAVDQAHANADKLAANVKPATATSPSNSAPANSSTANSAAKTSDATPKTALPSESAPPPVVAPLPVAEKKPEAAGSPPTPPTPGDFVPAKPATGTPPKPSVQVATLPARPNSTTAPASPKQREAPVVEPPPDVRLITNTGKLLGYDAGRDDWFVVDRGLKLPIPQPVGPPEPIGKGAGANVVVPTPPAPMPMDRRADQLAAPEPFDSMLEFGDGLCRVWLIGGTSVRLLAPAANLGTARFGIELREGRIVIQSSSPKPSGAAYRPLVIAVAVRDELWQLEFLKPNTQCGLEILPAFPTRLSEQAKDVGYGGGLYVVTGDVQFTESVGRQRTLTAGRWISLSPSDRGVATDLGGSVFRSKSGMSLSWLKPELRHVSATQSKINREFENDFLPDQPDQPVSLSIGTVAKNDPNPKIAEYATKTLALTKQIPSLVEVLAQVDHEEAVQAAANGLRAWLPLEPDHEGVLKRELSTTFQPAVQEIVLRLLWGYNNDDAGSQEASRQLVDLLDHDKVAVRVLALDHILELTGRTERKTSGQRKSVKKEWERYLERNKGVLIKP